MDTIDRPVTAPAGDETAFTPADEPGLEEAYVTLTEVESGDLDDDEADANQGREDDSGESAGERPKRKPGSARLKDRVRALERENGALRQERQASMLAYASDDDLVEPREQDFPNDYMAYDRALREYQTKRAVREESWRAVRAEAMRQAFAQQRERMVGYSGRLDGVKERIPDFDGVMATAGDIQIRNDVRDLILESPKGPLLAYYLAKNPDKIADLNRMSPWAVGKEIGSLEARIRGPNPRTVTRARAPAQLPRGGTATRGADLSRMSMADYIAARKAGSI